MQGEPLTPSAAKTLLVQILEHGRVEFSRHAIEELANDHISQQEALGVLRGGIVEPGEWERHSWRYRVRRSDLYVVVTFRSEDWTVVVTAWRRKRT